MPQKRNNMKLKILIVEDESIIALDLASKLKKNGYEMAGIADNAKDALQMAMDDEPDIALLDISIKGDTDGIHLAKALNDTKQIPIIYITSYSDRHTIERARLTFPYAYLIKPFRDVDLFNAIELAFRNAARQPVMQEGQDNTAAEVFTLGDRIFIRTGNASFEKLMLDDIRYIEADRSYCAVISHDKKYILSNSLNHILQNLCAEQIIRVHKSFAVNVKNISAIKDNSLIIYAKEIPIGAGYRQQLIATFKFLK